jgi:hypothetical protein
MIPFGILAHFLMILLDVPLDILMRQMIKDLTLMIKDLTLKKIDFDIDIEKKN